MTVIITVLVVLLIGVILTPGLGIEGYSNCKHSMGNKHTKCPESLCPSGVAVLGIRCETFCSDKGTCNCQCCGIGGCEYESLKASKDCRQTMQGESCSDNCKNQDANFGYLCTAWKKDFCFCSN